jgi:hypothetical protein
MMDVGAVEQLDRSEDEGVRFDAINGGTRFAWYPCAEASSSLEDAWAKVLRNNPGNEDQITSPAVVILDSELPSGTDCSGNGVAEISVIRENPGEVILQVRAEKTGWLFQADTWYPGWTAQVDGNAAPIYPANVAFRAVPVPAGEHEIKIGYQPGSLSLGAGITLLSGLGLIGWRVIRAKRSHKSVGGRIDKE